MARPPKNNADYFPHDNDMRNDRRIMALRKVFKHEGYAVWNMLLESIAGATNFKLDFSGFNPDLIAADFDVDTSKLHEITNYLLSIQLIQKEGDYIVCNTQKNRLSSLLRKRERDRSMVIDTENPQSKVKESKVNKIIPEELEFLNYCKAYLKEKYPSYEFTLKSKYEAFIQNNWCDGNDKPIKNWKTKIQNIIPHMPIDSSKIGTGASDKPAQYKPQINVAR